MGFGDGPDMGSNSNSNSNVGDDGGVPDYESGPPTGGDSGGVPDFESGSAQNTWSTMSPEMAEKSKAETERVLGDHGDPMGTPEEAAKYARYVKYQVKDQVNKEDSAFVKTLKFIGKAAAVVGTGGTALGLGDLGIVKFANVVNEVNKLSNTFVKGYNFLNKTNYTKTELFNKIQTDAKNRKKMNYELDKDPSGLDYGKDLVKKPVIDHGDNGQTNGTITESLKTKQMEEASRLAVIRQKELRDKQMAYWREMMKPYMSAKGGRVPGYNTGGLSNLFRLKTA
jgi:hypothetical protein